jgi:hypothetical protein
VPAHQLPQLPNVAWCIHFASYIIKSKLPCGRSTILTFLPWKLPRHSPAVCCRQFKFALAQAVGADHQTDTQSGPARCSEPHHSTFGNSIAINCDNAPTFLSSIQILIHLHLGVLITSLPTPILRALLPRTERHCT